MEYKGFIAEFEFDEDIGMYHGVVSNLRDVVNFYGATLEQLEIELKNSVEDYLDFCKGEPAFK